MKRLFIHCGLHKSGTTALQVFLVARREELAAREFFYPRAGCIGGGHHNIAWELARDRRFVRSSGDLAALSDEIAATNGDVVLSSEDFEGILLCPEAVARLGRLAADSGREVVFVLYLRNQIAYFESLFQEMLRHGFGEECSVLAREILATGQLRLKEWVFHFDYLEVAAMLRSLAGVQLVIRPYDRLSTGGIVDDFLSLLGIPAPLAKDVDPPRVNRRDEAGQSLMHFHANRAGSPAEGDAASFLAALASELAGKPPSLGNDLRQAFAERFDAGNRKLCAAEGLEANAFVLCGAEVVDCVRLERLFSFEVSAAARVASVDAGVRRIDAARLAAWCGARSGP